MKKTNATMLTAAAFAAALAMAPGAGNSSADAASSTLNTDGFEPAAMEMAAVYGPPPTNWTTASEEKEAKTTQTSAIPEELYNDATKDIFRNQLMYGPPSYFTDEIIPFKTTTTDDPFLYQVMYGPPGFFTDEFIPAGTTTDDFSRYQLMYGPPSYYTTPVINKTEPAATNVVTETYRTFQTVYGPTTVIKPTETAALREIDYPDAPEQPMYGPPMYWGDFNYDMKVNAFDLILAKQLLTNDNMPDWWSMKFSMDINQDGKFSLADVMLLNRYLLGQDVKFGGEPEEPLTTTATPVETDPVTEVRSELYGVYGPPPSFNTTTAAVPEPIKEVTTEMQDVYGPPPSYYNNK